MKRRAFLVGLGAVLAAPAAFLALPGCNGGTTAPAPADSFRVTSSTESGPGGTPHNHALTVLLADLASPPAAGVTSASSTVAGHAHQVTISAAELAAIEAGGTVAVPSSVELGHGHTFTIRKP